MTRGRVRMASNLAPSAASYEIGKLQARVDACKKRIRILRAIGATSMVVFLVVFFVLIDRFLGKQPRSARLGRELDIVLL